MRYASTAIVSAVGATAKSSVQAAYNVAGVGVSRIDHSQESRLNHGCIKPRKCDNFSIVMA
jgi:hypothetical protein|tara:strand:- start:407 stop:589 length:183 start_codon:yes stop_codon:yes gene_type:complete